MARVRSSWVLSVMCLALMACSADEQREAPTVVEPSPCADWGVAFAPDSCMQPGVPVDGCGEGFASDGLGGCVAVLPQDPCGKGTMAVPGETSCRPVAPCGEGTWGEIPVEAGTEYVDPSYANNDSDGSDARPWKSIAEALAAASPNDIVALAAGSYLGGATIAGTPVRLWGKCPSEVEIVGPTGDATIIIRAAGTELHDLAATGPFSAVIVDGAEQVTLDRVYIHDIEHVGIEVGDWTGAASATISRSLVENVQDVGVFVFGATVVVEQSAIRDTQPVSNGEFGVAIELVGGQQSQTRSNLEIRASVLERNHDATVLGFGASLLVETTVMRDVLSRVSDGSFGRAIDIEDDPANGNRSDATVRSSVIERAHDVAIFGAGADVTIEHTVIRDIAPRALDGRFGRGLTVQGQPDLAQRGQLNMTGSLVERCSDAGVVVGNADAVITDTIVRDVAPRPFDGGFGDGVAVLRSVFEQDAATVSSASASLVRSRIERSGRSGVASFGAAVRLDTLLLVCNALSLNGEASDSVPFSFDDAGGNLCGCDAVQEDCKSLSANLTPPEPVK